MSFFEGCPVPKKISSGFDNRQSLGIPYPPPSIITGILFFDPNQANGAHWYERAWLRIMMSGFMELIRASENFIADKNLKI